MGNLYVHFPFCRRKCSYCALYSLTGLSIADRNAYVESVAKSLSNVLERFEVSPDTIRTVYFGGGSPAWGNLTPIFNELRRLRVSPEEFTVELHPQDVTDATLSALVAGGVNRISMGVQSLDDPTLAKMGRGYRVAEAAAAFRLIRRYFDNAGIDLILGYPGDPSTGYETLADWGLKHCSVYSLIWEPNSRLARQTSGDRPQISGDRPQDYDQTSGDRPQISGDRPQISGDRPQISGDRPQISGDRPQISGDRPQDYDDWVMDKLSQYAGYLERIGLCRYEISNYSVEGYECRHNQAVWRGEDYLGIGAGAHGRIGRWRLENVGYPWGLSPEIWGLSPASRGLSPASRGLSPEIWGLSPEAVEMVDLATDCNERILFRLRTREGLDVTGHPEWAKVLEKYQAEGLLTRSGEIFQLTPRGMEVCDSILADLV